MKEFMLPIHKIKKGSNVVLYGAGKLGRKMWNINQSINWCNIHMVLDKNHDRIQDFPVKVNNPKCIELTNEYDYVLLAVVSESYRLEAEELLISYGVDDKKIIKNISYIYDDEQVEFDNRYSNDYDTQSSIKIAFHPIGSMGDLIISLKVYQQIAMTIDGCRIDVFADNVEVAKKIFFLQEKLGSILKYEERIDISKYDVFLETRFVPHLKKCNIKKLEHKSPALADMMSRIYFYQNKYRVVSDMFQYENRILVDRANFYKLNRYQLLDISGALHIEDTNVDFYIDEKFNGIFNNLKLKDKYITYNYGAHDQNGDGTPQVKLWPYEYHVELNKMLKDRFPDYELIQLGDLTAKKIPRADRYLFGESLDVVKYILKNSSVHFDCEGGLVHMATQLNTKCVVVFGPTPVWFYGYKDNINIPPKICGECKGLYYDWYTVCHKYKRPECMWSIKPEEVLSAIGSILERH